MIQLRTSPVYVNRMIQQDWMANGGVYGTGGVYMDSHGGAPYTPTGPTLDLSFVGIATAPLAVPGVTDFSLNLDFVAGVYQVTAPYAIWE